MNSFEYNIYLGVEEPDTKKISSVEIVHKDNDLARKANGLVKGYFGQRIQFTYEMYCEWREKNPNIFCAVLSGKQFLGFIDVFPLTSEGGCGILNGYLTEDELGIDDLLNYNNEIESNYIHFASVVSCYFSNHIRALIETIAWRYVFFKYPPRIGRTYTAIASTVEGRRALERFGFTQEIKAEQAKDGQSVFALQSENINYRKFERSKNFNIPFSERTESSV